MTKLKKVIKQKGVSAVAYELGYRSQNTIYKWIRNNEIPLLARDRVKKYLTKSKGQ